MVCAFALSAISDGEEWSGCSEERRVLADDVWIHPHHVVSGFIAAALVLLDSCRDHLARSASYACDSHASHFALATSGSYRGFDTFLRVDGSSILFVESMKPWPNKSPEPTAVGAVSSAIAVHVAGRRWLSFFR